jgi:beta-glucosidase
VEAGADILLMPVDPEEAIAAVVQAVTSGRISLARIKKSVERIWEAKQKVCLQEVTTSSHPDEETFLTTRLAQTQSFAIVEGIIRDSLVVDGIVEGVMGVDLSRNLDIYNSKFLNLIYVDEAIDCDFLGRNTPAITIPQGQNYRLQILDKNSTGIFDSPDTARNLDPQQQTLVQLFIRGNPFRGSAGATDYIQNLVKKLLHKGELQALVVYGSPYAYQRLRALLPTAIPSIFTYAQIPMAQAIALYSLFETLVNISTQKNQE